MGPPFVRAEDWQDETPEDWDRNKALLDRYRDVTGIGAAAAGN